MAFNVSYIYQILDKYSGPLQRISRATDRFNRLAKRAQKSVARIGDKLGAASSKLSSFSTALGAAGAAGALTKIFSTSLRFEKSMNTVQSVTQATEEQMGKLSAQAKKLGETTQFSASESASAMSYLGMAGLKVNDIMGVMPGMLNLAAAGQMALGDAADISTNILAAFGMEVSEIGRVSDVLAYSAAKSNTTVYEMAEVMKNVAATANLAGVSLEETTSMAMILANAGIKGGNAGTQLMNALKAIAAMAPKTAKGLAKFGIDPRKVSDSQGRIRDLTGLIDKLGKRGATMGDLFSIFDIRGAKAVAVLGESGGKSIREFTKKLQESEGTAKTMAGILMKGFPGALKEFMSVVESVVLVLAEALLPSLIDLLHKFKAFLNNLKENHPTLLKFIAWGLVATLVITSVIVVLGIILGALGSVITAFSSLGFLIPIVSGAFSILAGAIAIIGWPVAAIIAVVGALGALIFWLRKAENRTKALNWLVDVWGIIKNEISIFISFLKDEVFPILAKVSPLFRIGAKIVDFTKGLADNKAKSETAAQKLSLTGEIAVAAEPGSKVSGATINSNLNTGLNMATQGI